MIGRLVVVAMLLGMNGCGALVLRNPLPAQLVEQAEIPGLPDIRYWGDHYDAGMVQSIRESWEQERAHLGLGPDDPLPPCHDLAISGGGQDGAFGAGLLYGWTESGKRPEFKIVTGISTGALTAPFAFLGSEYDEQLAGVYTSVSEVDIFVSQGIFTILRADSVMNTAPLAKLAARYITPELVEKVAEEHRKGRRLFIGTTNLDAQRPVIWDMGALACSDYPEKVQLFRKILIASAAIPGAFPPVYFPVEVQGQKFDEMHVDGATTRELFFYPVEMEIEKIRARANVRREATSIYIIANHNLGAQYQLVPPRVAAIAGRAIATLIKTQMHTDLVSIYHAAVRDKLDFNLASIPESIELKNVSMFDKVYMNELFAVGRSLASGGYPWQKRPPLLSRTVALPVIPPPEAPQREGSDD
jgi:predicted acylesterase/phospholipase RssA